jgi:hypothetical protein
MNSTTYGETDCCRLDNSMIGKREREREREGERERGREGIKKSVAGFLTS